MGIFCNQLSPADRNATLLRNSNQTYLRRVAQTKCQFSVDHCLNKRTDMILIFSLLSFSTFVVGQNKFDIDVDSAVKWSTDILRSKGNLFPAGPTLSARHTSLNALVKFHRFRCFRHFRRFLTFSSLSTE
jgi:hypothetical protein